MVFHRFLLGHKTDDLFLNLFFPSSVLRLFREGGAMNTMKACLFAILLSILFLSRPVLYKGRLRCRTRNARVE